MYIRPFVTWNEKGEAAISGEEIPNSNIIDLVKVVLQDNKNFRPSGVEQLNRLLNKKKNVLRSLLTVRRRGQVGQGSILPPARERKGKTREKEG